MEGEDSVKRKVCRVMCVGYVGFRGLIGAVVRCTGALQELMQLKNLIEGVIEDDSMQRRCKCSKRDKQTETLVYLTWCDAGSNPLDSDMSFHAPPPPIIDILECRG